MPLYNNILLSRSKSPSSDTQAKSTASNVNRSANSASLRFLQDHLLSKQRAKQQSSQSQSKGKPQKSSINRNQVVSESALHKSLDGDWNLEDEYDPMVPNSYELLLSEHIKAEEKKLVKVRSSKIDPSILGILDTLDGDDCDVDLHNNSNTGTAIAPPPSLSRTVATSDSDNQETTIKTKSYSDDTFTSPLRLMDETPAAAKIMPRIDYKPGQSYNERGNSSPSEVQKNAKGGFLSLQKTKREENNSPVGEEIIKSVDKVSSLLEDSTRVVLLQNMVGSGQVDDDLDAETKEECKKYGEVLRCLIYEIPNKRVPDSEAVRIFVEFKNVESAIKAVSDLNGRYFGGRVVRASFYDLDRFKSYDLGS